MAFVLKIHAKFFFIFMSSSSSTFVSAEARARAEQNRLAALARRAAAASAASASSDVVILRDAGGVQGLHVALNLVPPDVERVMGEHIMRCVDTGPGSRASRGLRSGFSRRLKVCRQL